MTEGNRKAHRRTCTGGGRTDNTRQCGACGAWVSKANYARHVRGCEARGAVGGVGIGREAPQGRRGPCPSCGVEMSVANMARHLRRCRRVWDPGRGGAAPLTGDDSYR